MELENDRIHAAIIDPEATEQARRRVQVKLERLRRGNPSNLIQRQTVRASKGS